MNPHSSPIRVFQHACVLREGYVRVDSRGNGVGIDVGIDTDISTRIGIGTGIERGGDTGPCNR